MRSTIPRIGVLLAILALILAACGGTGGASQEPGQSGAAASEPAGESEPPTGEVVEIRWYCCLGAGDDPAQVEVEQAVVDAFNESHPDIHVTLEVVEYEEAYDILAVQLNSPNPPDVVGPAGISGAEAFHGQWLDLQPLVDSTGYDLSQFAEGSVDFYRSDEFGLEGLPFAIFPSMLYYQRDMFDEADLEYPPHAYGDPYVLDGEEVTWDFDTLRELALRLTVDENGNDATSPDFDPDAIVQWGYEPQYQDLRAQGSYWGAGSLVADDGTTAQIPEQWQEAWTWFYQGVWTDHFIMNEAQAQDPTIGATGNPFQSGNVAMALSHLWYTCCASATDEDGNFVDDPNWDMAAVPEFNGTVTSNFNADTFRILEKSQHPEEAFEFLTYLLGEASDELLQLYGGLPGRDEAQDAFFAGLDERWTQGVDWQVAIDGIPFADNPSFEGYMPNYQEAFTAIQGKLTDLRSTPDLDIEAEIAAFTEELQGIFDRAE
jgi:multiple sugar transport system substrate-binding protein